MKAAIAEGQSPEDRGRGQISLVGAGPGTGDLMTLRTVQRLQEASQQVWEPAPDIGKQLAHLLIATERIFSPSPPLGRCVHLVGSGGKAL